MSAVNTNIQARQVQSALAQNTRHLDHTMAGLSTGKRINSASDDSAGSAISTKLATQARSLNMAVRNTNDGISMMQTADGAAGGIQDMLHRMKELAVQSINDTYSSDERTVLNSEFQHLESQIRDTVANTTWNSMKLLDGSLGNSSSLAKYQVGASADDMVAVTFADLDLTTKPLTTSRTIDTGANANTALTPYRHHKIWGNLMAGLWTPITLKPPQSWRAA
jgi:flagellin